MLKKIIDSLLGVCQLFGVIIFFVSLRTHYSGFANAPVFMVIGVLMVAVSLVLERTMAKKKGPDKPQTGPKKNLLIVLATNLGVMMGVSLLVVALTIALTFFSFFKKDALIYGSILVAGALFCFAASYFIHRLGQRSRTAGTSDGKAEPERD